MLLLARFGVSGRTAKEIEKVLRLHARGRLENIGDWKQIRTGFFWTLMKIKVES